MKLKQQYETDVKIEDGYLIITQDTSDRAPPSIVQLSPMQFDFVLGFFMKNQEALINVWDNAARAE